jgi:hypothetical protein
VVTVKVACDLTPVNGLVLADFVVLDSAGSPVTVTAAPETGDGEYTLASAAAFADDDTITLDAPASLSVYPQSAYEANTVMLVVPFPSV